MKIENDRMADETLASRHRSHAILVLNSAPLRDTLMHWRLRYVELSGNFLLGM